ncbi:MAG: hypothetical protein WAQ24_04130 [Candidatus Saccharimonadales bacterium]
MSAEIDLLEQINTYETVIHELVVLDRKPGHRPGLFQVVGTLLDGENLMGEGDSGMPFIRRELTPEGDYLLSAGYRIFQLGGLAAQFGIEPVDFKVGVARFRGDEMLALQPFDDEHARELRKVTVDLDFKRITGDLPLVGDDLTPFKLYGARDGLQLPQ